ncbi:hypothetical protein GGR52DRAFT_573942 [Hypoxylon sp. FL1284]|nr:hypothetical protein GGR52DRAFT_573942 [Hypoxylon sp. FL1284]
MERTSSPIPIPEHWIEDALELQQYGHDPIFHNSKYGRLRDYSYDDFRWITTRVPPPPPPPPVQWTEAEDETLKELVAQYGVQDWRSVSLAMPTGKSEAQCRNRWAEIVPGLHENAAQLAFENEADESAIGNTRVVSRGLLRLPRATATTRGRRSTSPVAAMAFRPPSPTIIPMAPAPTCQLSPLMLPEPSLPARPSPPPIPPRIFRAPLRTPSPVFLLPSWSPSWLLPSSFTAKPSPFSPPARASPPTTSVSEETSTVHFPLWEQHPTDILQQLWNAPLPSNPGSGGSAAQTRAESPVFGSPIFGSPDLGPPPPTRPPVFGSPDPWWPPQLSLPMRPKRRRSSSDETVVPWRPSSSRSSTPRPAARRPEETPAAPGENKAEGQEQEQGLRGWQPSPPMLRLYRVPRLDRTQGDGEQTGETLDWDNMPEVSEGSCGQLETYVPIERVDASLISFLARPYLDSDATVSPIRVGDLL